eukprot:Gb_26773 [translate_table: standard]
MPFRPENYGDIPLLVLDPAPAALDILLYPRLQVEDPKRTRESTGNNGEEGVHVAATPILSSRFGIYYERIHLKPPHFYGTTSQQIFFLRCIAPTILRALAAMAEAKVKRPSTHSLVGPVGHVGSIRTSFSCGTVEGIQSLLIGISIHVSMTIDGFAIIPTLRQTRVKYIADLGAPAGTNHISAITSSITMFPYARIPPLAGLRSKFHSFSTASGCGAYSQALMGVVTNAIGRWAAGRLPEPFPSRLGNNGEVHPAGENRPINNRRAKHQWHAKHMQNGRGKKETTARRSGREAAEPIPWPCFLGWAQSSVF